MGRLVPRAADATLPRLFGSGPNRPLWDEVTGAFRLDNSRQHSKATVHERD
jgi:hypothetical protein